MILTYSPSPAFTANSFAVTKCWGSCLFVNPHYFFYGYPLIPDKLANKITSCQFVKLTDVLLVNLKANDSETQIFLESKLVVAPAQKRTVEIQDILTWVKVFPNYCLVLCASQLSRWADLSHYKLLIIQTAKKFPGKAWQHYDTFTTATGLKDWSKINPGLYNFHMLGLPQPRAPFRLWATVLG